MVWYVTSISKLTSYKRIRLRYYTRLFPFLPSILSSLFLLRIQRTPDPFSLPLSFHENLTGIFAYTCVYGFQTRPATDAKSLRFAPAVAALQQND